MAFMNGSQTQTALLDLIDECRSFSIITAWATPNDVFDAIKQHVQKIRHIIIGVDFYGTSPVVLNWLQQHAPQNTRIGQSVHGTFHPKIYIFDIEHDGTRTVVIGSANLTKAAFTMNDEFCVSVNAKLSSIRNTLDNWIENSIPINDFDLDEYTEEYNTSGAEIRRVATSRARVINNRRGGCIDDFKRHPNLLNLFFDDYYWLCTQAKNAPNEYEKRIELMDFCAQPAALTNHDYFCCFAGLPPRTPFANTPAWGWFGGMTAVGGFRDSVRDIRLDQQPPTVQQQLVTLLQTIPRNGQVQKGDYDNFFDNFMVIINNWCAHSNGTYKTRYNANMNYFSAPLRLLAMWRPDFFFA